MTPLAKYAQVLENLSADSTTALAECLADSVTFSDPFNQVQGRAGYLVVMQDMFERLNDVRFEVHDQLGNDKTGYLYWTFHAHSKLTGSFSFEGTSRLTFDEEGRVIRHQDFWDASELFIRVPVLGSVLKLAKRKAACPGV